MPAEFTVTTFQPGTDSADEIAAIHLEIRRGEEADGLVKFTDITSSQKDLKALEEFYIAGGGNFFVAKDSEGKVIGFMGLKNRGNGRGDFKRLAVISQWRRQGVARALISHAMEWARTNGFSLLHLQTNSNEHAKPIYEDFGFKIVGWVDEKKDWLMECGLSADPVTL